MRGYTRARSPVERGDEAHQVHDLAAPVPVREVERDDVDAGERVGERRDRGFVGPVADAHEERLRVQPDRVAALDERGLAELGRDRHARVRQASSRSPPAPSASPPCPAARAPPPQIRRARGRRRRSHPDCPHRGARRRPPHPPPRAGRERARARRTRPRRRGRHASRTHASARRPRRAEAGRARARACRSWTQSRIEPSQDATPRSSAYALPGAPPVRPTRRASPSRDVRLASHSRCAA